MRKIEKKKEKVMKTIETMLKEEMKQLQGIIKEANKRLQNVPKGRLRVSNKKTHMEYYYIDGGGEGKKNGRYLGKKEKGLAKQIAQRDYDNVLVKSLTEQRNAIECFLKKYKRNSLDAVYENTNSYRRELLDKVYVSDEEYIRQWLRVQYEGKELFDDMPFFMTERGERVRSKSEKIIADKLYMMGIPYRYEYPLVLNDDIIVYPDFTILRMPGREEVYLEHLGMMDNMDYVNTTLYKINTYENNGIYLGVNLFFTYETSKRPLNTKVLKEMFKSLFDTE